MRSLLTPSYYRDEALFRRELDTLFCSSWQLIGFTHDLRNPNDYVVRTVNGKSIVIQNFAGELRAFHNVCSHRQSRIRSEASGNGPLRCPYHGWTYNRAGVPFSIPNKPLFDAADLECADDLSLDRFAVDTCGSLLFIRMDENGPSLREFLADAYDHLQAAGSALGEQLSCYPMVIRANWKVIVENTLEGYHVNYVHAHSLKRLGTSGVDVAIQDPHSTYRSTTEQKPGPTRDRLNAAFRSRPFQTDDYIHQLVFPNATIATAHGTSFNVNLMRPLSAGETEVLVYVFETKLGELTRAEQALVKAMRPSVVDLTNTTFDEDKAICEQVQLGLSETSRVSILSTEERRIEAFHTAYLARLEVKAA
jgi:phenylpropionate dioxygenase-like ring-hydroxylating dioxygenase large terminal subunit